MILVTLLGLVAGLLTAVGARPAAAAVTVSWQRLSLPAELIATERRDLSIDADAVYWVERRAVEPGRNSWVFVRANRVTNQVEVLAELSDNVLTGFSYAFATAPDVVAWHDLDRDEVRVHDLGRGAGPVGYPASTIFGLDVTPDRLVYIDEAGDRPVIERHLGTGEQRTLGTGGTGLVIASGDTTMWNSLDGLMLHDGVSTSVFAELAEPGEVWDDVALDHGWALGLSYHPPSGRRQLYGCALPCASGAEVLFVHDEDTEGLSELAAGPGKAVLVQTNYGFGGQTESVRTVTLSTGASRNTTQVLADDIGSFAIDASGDLALVGRHDGTPNLWLAPGAGIDGDTSDAYLVAGVGSGAVPASRPGIDLAGGRFAVAQQRPRVLSSPSRLVAGQLGTATPVHVVTPPALASVNPPTLIGDDVVWGACDVHALTCAGGGDDAAYRSIWRGAGRLRLDPPPPSDLGSEPIASGTATRSDFACATRWLCSYDGSTWAQHNAGVEIVGVRSTNAAAVYGVSELTPDYEETREIRAWSPTSGTDDLVGYPDAGGSPANLAVDGEVVVATFEGVGLGRAAIDLGCGSSCEDPNDVTPLGVDQTEVFDADDGRVLTYGTITTGSGEFTEFDTDLWLIEGTSSPQRVNLPSDDLPDEISLSGTRALLRDRAGQLWLGDVGGAALPAADTTAPSAVTGLSASGVTDGVALSWTPSTASDAVNTWVVRTVGAPATDPYAADATMVYHGRGSSFVDLTARTGTTYTYTAFALDGAGNLSSTSHASAAPTGSAADRDGDGWADDSDNCPDVANRAQTDATGDGTGNACATDGSGGGSGGDGGGDTAPLVRYGGENRYETAALTVTDRFAPGVSHVYVATGTNFPDALAAAALAGRDGGPVLLVQRDAVPPEVGQALEYLEPGAISVVGGPAVVTDRVLEQLRSYTSGLVDRLWGESRFDTAAELARRYAGNPQVFVATGLNFPDALAGTVPAILRGGPILLVSRDAVPSATADVLQELQPERITILGGSAVVSPAVEQQLRAFTAGTVDRLWGENRFETAVRVSQATFATAAAVYVATAFNFPDALAGGAPAGIEGAPLLLVPSWGQVPAVVLDEITRLAPSSLIVLGGPNAVSQEVVDQLQARM